MPMQIMSTIKITIIMNMIEIIVTTTIIIIMIAIMLMTIIKIMSTMKMVTDKLMRRITHLFYLMMTKNMNNKKLKINIHTIVTESLMILTLMTLNVMILLKKKSVIVKTKKKTIHLNIKLITV